MSGAVIDQGIRATRNCRYLSSFIKKKKRKNTFATPSLDGMTSSQPASSLLVFFYFCFHSPRVA